MTGRLAHIVRHPIKSVGWEELTAAVLETGAVLPFDRHWAVAHAAARFEGAPEGWQAKANFVRGVAGPKLMAIEARLSADGTRIVLQHPDQPALEIAPDSPDADAALLAWLAPLWPDSRPPAARIVRADGFAMTDVPDAFVSILNLVSLRALGQRMGRDLSIHRFRGNLWVDGFAPWEEGDWIGRDLRIGGARLRVVEPITRCNATKANPATGLFDADTLGALDEAFGHHDFGVYAMVTEGGAIAVGDEAGLA